MSCFWPTKHALFGINYKKNNDIYRYFWFDCWFIFISSELYYKDTEITQKQENVSEALKTICCFLDATPWELGVLSTSKGLIAGPLEIHLPDNVVIDCNIDKNGENLSGNLNEFRLNKNGSNSYVFFFSFIRNYVAAFDKWYCWS